MTPGNPTKLSIYMNHAVRGTAEDIDFIMQDLNDSMSFAGSRFIDYALGLVASPEGVARITYYLFEGSQIQRNYCTLFFNRRCEKGDWELVKKAFSMGLIDAKQAFSK